MNKYTGALCPVCKKKIQQDDDMVVCPVCGAPYHRDCYNKQGQCILTDLHEKGEDWKDTSREDAQQKYDGTAPAKCPRCGAQNPSDAIFCQVCGSPMDSQNPTPFGTRPSQNIPYNPFMSPFGGVDPESEMDGIRAKDMAVYVGQNTTYFLPRFKIFQKKEKAFDFNWSAFIFGPFYFMFRKMWKYAIIAGVIMLALELPSIPYNMQVMTSMLQGTATPVISNTVNIIFTVLSFLSFVFRFCMGFFCNRLYMKHVFSRIHTLQQQYQQDPHTAVLNSESEYYKALVKKGGISKVSCLIVLGIYILLQYIALFVFTALAK